MHLYREVDPCIILIPVVARRCLRLGSLSCYRLKVPGVVCLALIFLFEGVRSGTGPGHRLPVPFDPEWPHLVDPFVGILTPKLVVLIDPVMLVPPCCLQCLRDVFTPYSVLNCLLLLRKIMLFKVPYSPLPSYYESPRGTAEKKIPQACRSVRFRQSAWLRPLGKEHRWYCRRWRSKSWSLLG